MHIDRRDRLLTMTGLALAAVLTLSSCGDDAGNGQVDQVPNDDSEESVGSGEPTGENDEMGESPDDTAASTEESGDASGSDDTAAPGSGGAEDLVPPGVVNESDLGAGVLYRSEASFDEVVAHYDAVMGEANFVNADEVAGVWTGEIDGARTSVNLSAGEDGLLDILVSTIG